MHLTRCLACTHMTFAATVHSVWQLIYCRFIFFPLISFCFVVALLSDVLWYIHMNIAHISFTFCCCYRSTVIFSFRSWKKNWSALNRNQSMPYFFSFNMTYAKCIGSSKKKKNCRCYHDFLIGHKNHVLAII